MTFTKDQISSVNLRAGRFDMTRIPRLRTDFTDSDNVLNASALNALNERVNEHSERCEDLWIELDLQLIDAIEAEKERKRNRKVNVLKRQCIDLFKDGYMASEIHSITRASLQDIAKWTKKVTFDDAVFDDCPEDIKNDLLSEFE
tara:strand:- start:775 stop:1209 length:435 start_codon:yes stop_codon:yes gene_type:complete